MNILSLKEKILSIGISEAMLCFNESCSEMYDVFCISECEGCWEVYYSEGRGKDNLRIFSSESEACDAFYAWMIELKGSGLVSI